MDIVKNIYYNPQHIAGFSNISKLINILPKNYTKEQVQNWLQAQETYTLHKPLRKHFARNKYHVTNINDLFEADLVDVQSLSKFNNGYKYLLTVIDVFSKYAWVRPIKSKNASDIVAAFTDIITASGRIPINLQTDKGKEFLAQPVKQLYKKYDIKHIVTENPDIKASVIERFNRTLKTKMFKYFTFSGNYKYLNVLQKFVDAYNKTKHRTIKMAPTDVNEENILEVYNNAFGNIVKNKNKNKFNMGDYVRITKYKHVFQKGYESNWTMEIFKINQVIKRNPFTVYKICDLQNEPITGVFYEQELQKVHYSDDSEFKIDKIIRKRRKAGISEVFVKWKGYPNKFNSWVPESYIT